MSDNLRALLGDKYDDVIERAKGFDAPPGACDCDACATYVTSAVLAAVLPDLLADARREGQADAWDEGAQAAWERSTPEVNGARYHWRTSGAPTNPYRTEGDPRE